MAQAVELPISYEGADKAIDQINKVAQSVEGVAKAFKGDMIVKELGKLSSSFDGFTGQALKGVESLAKGFLAGGPLGLAIAGAGVAIGALAEQYKKQEEEARKAQEAREAVLAQEKQALNDVLDKLREAQTLFAAIKQVRDLGGDADEAASIARRNDAFKKLTDSQEELVAARRVASDTERKLAEADDLVRRAAGIRNFERKREEIAAELAANKERVRQLEADEKRLQKSLQAIDVSDQTSDEARVQTAIKGEREARARAAEQRRKEQRENALKQGEELANLFYADEKRKIEEARRLEQEAEDDRLKDAIRITETRNKIIAEAEKKRLAEAAKAADEAQKDAERRAKEEAAAFKAAEEEKLKAAQKAAEERQRLNDQIFAAGESLARQAFDAITGEEQVTKAELEEKAKRAALEAAFQTAVGFANLAASRPDAATSAFISAAQFAAIAGGNAVASAVASDAPAAAASPAGTGPTRSTSSGGSRSGSGSGDGAPQVTVVLPSGELYPSKGDMYRALREANHQMARRR
jgi:hypothetical protein